jgi:hypothetical protein
VSRTRFLSSALLLLLATAAWLPGRAQGQAPAKAVRGLDACSLLTSADILAVVGEPVREAKASSRSNAAFEVHQCFYRAQTFSKSVSLELIRQQAKPGARNIREFWREKFHHDTSGEDKDDDRSPQLGASSRPLAGEENEGLAAQPISGVGEEAYWAGEGITAALYVLQRDRMIRVSLGGPEDEKSKINKAKLLAQVALHSLQGTVEHL